MAGDCGRYAQPIRESDLQGDSIPRPYGNKKPPEKRFLRGQRLGISHAPMIAQCSVGVYNAFRHRPLLRFSLTFND